MTGPPSPSIKSSSNHVRVVARIRPLAQAELENGSKETVRKVIISRGSFALDGSAEFVEAFSPHGDKRKFELDAVLDKSCSQEEVYEISGTKEAVCESIFNGFNCTILAYGQTSSGKTYSMGSAGAPSCDNPHSAVIDEQAGIIPRACHDLFRQIEEKCDGNAEVELSYLEIYNEQLRDLLSSNNDKNDNLRIRETFQGEVYVEGLTARSVTSPLEVGALMEEALSRRVTASTSMNAVSSRSHAICILRVKGLIENEDGATDTFTSKLTLVDLAGSERIKKTGARGHRKKEGININKSLLVLGQVVSALAEQNKKNSWKPPYRDSKLTRILQDSLGGNSRTIMLTCVSPADNNVEESINTLRYATSARNIKNTATRNIIKVFSPEEGAKLLRENQLLKLQVQEMQRVMEQLSPRADVSAEDDYERMLLLQKKVDDLQRALDLMSTTEDQTRLPSSKTPDTSFSSMDEDEVATADNSISTKASFAFEGQEDAEEKDADSTSKAHSRVFSVKEDDTDNTSKTSLHASTDDDGSFIVPIPTRHEKFIVKLQDIYEQLTLIARKTYQKSSTKLQNIQFDYQVPPVPYEKLLPPLPCFQIDTSNIDLWHLFVATLPLLLCLPQLCRVLVPLVQCLFTLTWSFNQGLKFGTV